MSEEASAVRCWLHRYTRWSDPIEIATNLLLSGNTGLDWIQKRHCLRCNRMEWRMTRA